MGRLFWRFFFFLLLAQGLAAFGVGLAVHLHHQERSRLAPAIDDGPPALDLVSAASATLRHGGQAALKDFLRDLQTRPHAPKVLAVDANDRELLDRPVLPNTLAQARSALDSPVHDHVQQIQGSDGQSYLLFLPRPQGQDSRVQGQPPDLQGPNGPMPPPGGKEKGLFPLTPVLIGTLVSLILAALLARHFSHPIQQLKMAFTTTAQGQLEHRVAPLMGKRRDELASLGTEFDHMAERLQAMIHQHRRLLHDVSHELRSPLARLQAAIGLLRQRPDESEALLLRIEREAGRMDHLVGEILTLSRLDTGLSSQIRTPVDLGEILADLLDDARFEAASKNCRIKAPEARSLMVEGDGELLHRALENVVRNALQYSPIGGEVLITQAQQGDTLILTVADQGPGVAESERDAIFQAFHRSPLAPAGKGYGLGLAITRSVINAHGGSVSADNLSPHGLVVTISLPLANKPLYS